MTQMITIIIQQTIVNASKQVMIFISVKNCKNAENINNSVKDALMKNNTILQIINTKSATVIPQTK